VKRKREKERERERGTVHSPHQPGSASLFNFSPDIHGTNAPTPPVWLTPVAISAPTDPKLAGMQPVCAQLAANSSSSRILSRGPGMAPARIEGDLQPFVPDVGVLELVREREREKERGK